MARYQVIIAYDGTLFAGFQRQVRARTVQGELEAALRQLGWQGRAILSAGRTDTGAHAQGNAAAFDLEWKHPAVELLGALNALLPVDASIQGLREAAADFHPRYHALWRHYRYQVVCLPVRNPLRERYAWRVWPAPDADAMGQAAALFVGWWDFAVFGSPTRPGGSTVREVFSSSWKAENGELVYEVRANAFLYHMVRRLVALQIKVGQGLLGREEIEAGLTSGKVQPPGLAPAQGLCLMEVGYPDPSRGGMPRIDRKQKVPDV
ncbi:MAG TPA: tRNA pseudouridine(38-40) synthase TruA [Anaerolineaceae bacterium]